MNLDAPHPSSRFVAIGKFAGDGEFLRAPNEEPLAAFDAWLDAGMDHALARHGAAWPVLFPMGMPHAMLWRAPRAAAHDDRFLGVVAPSRDAVGRSYPFAVGVRVPSALLARAPHIAPLAFGDLLDGVHALLAEARAVALTRSELDDRLRALPRPSAEAVAYAAEDYDDWCRTTPIEVGWRALFPGTDSLEAAARVIDRIGAAVAPFRRHEAPDTPLTLRLPLGDVGPAAAALWIDVVRRACGWTTTVPTAFWSVHAGALLVPVGRAHPALLGELWIPDATSDYVFDAGLDLGADVVPPSGLHPRALALRDKRSDATMQDLLDAIAR